MKTIFETAHYEFTHGKKPSGGGAWHFKVHCDSEAQKAMLLASYSHGLVTARDDKTCVSVVRLAARNCASYSDAKHKVRTFLKGHDVCRVYVCARSA